MTWTWKILSPGYPFKQWYICCTYWCFDGKTSLPIHVGFHKSSCLGPWNLVVSWHPDIRTGRNTIRSSIKYIYIYPGYPQQKKHPLSVFYGCRDSIHLGCVFQVLHFCFKGFFLAKKKNSLYKVVFHRMQILNMTSWEKLDSSQGRASDSNRWSLSTKKSMSGRWRFDNRHLKKQVYI